VSVELVVRKTWTQVEEIRRCGGEEDPSGPLRKVAACAVIVNPLAGQGFVANLSALVDASGELGAELGKAAVAALGEPVASYGKGAIAGVAGEQEHANAMLTSVFGNALRDAVGGGRAWITSATKVAPAGSAIDIPLAFKDDIWVRSHYDALQVRVEDAPLPDEILVIAAVANRGRLNARLGGRTLEQARAEADQ
jgi:hypothetical protein